MTQQNAALVEQTASASEEMAGQAQELLVLMTQFKIKNDMLSGKNIISKTPIQKKDTPGKKTKAFIKPEAAVKPHAAAKPEVDKSADNKPVNKGVKEHMEDDGFEAF